MYLFGDDEAIKRSVKIDYDGTGAKVMAYRYSKTKPWSGSLWCSEKRCQPSKWKGSCHQVYQESHVQNH